MTSTGFLQLPIDAPPFKASAYGLLQTVTVRENTGVRPLAGGTFPSAAAGDSTGALMIAGDCYPFTAPRVAGPNRPEGAEGPFGVQGTAGNVKLPNLGDTWTDAIPMAGYGWWRCAAAGYTVAEAQDRAQTMFLAGESRLLEGLLWGMNGAPVHEPSLPEALAAAEDKIASAYGGEGLIHMSRGTATLLAYHLTRVGSTLRTIGCYTPVVVGDGYTDLNVIVATGAMVVVRGPLESLTPDPGAAMDRATNQLSGMVERAYLVAADGPSEAFDVVAPI